MKNKPVALVKVRKTKARAIKPTAEKKSNPDIPRIIFNRISELSKAFISKLNQAKPKIRDLTRFNAKKKSTVSMTRAEYRRFISKCKSDFNAVFTGIYRADGGDIDCVAGENINSEIILERCLSFTSSTILINPGGFSDNPGLKSRLITQFTANGGRYLICFGSYALEGFKTNSAEVIKTAAEFCGVLNTITGEDSQ